MNTPSAILLFNAVASLGVSVPFHEGDPAKPIAPQRINANDNRRPAGTLRDGKLELKLDVVEAAWFPEAETGPSVMMQAFAEVGRAPEIPGPMIRVPEGTEIHVTIHNSLPDSEVVVRGLHARPATTDDVVRIPAGATREVTFHSGVPGTYYYWATSTNQTMTYRVGKDSQLSGAIIVDPRVGPASTDRTFVIGLYSDDPDSAAGREPHPREIAVINGKSWPHTERFTFTEGDTVAWRVISVTPGPHPMHLHGFYFDVQRSGGEAADTALPASAVSRANTRLVQPGGTMAMRFVPNRRGNWLFHCHLALHVDGMSTLQNVLKRRPLHEMERDHEKTSHGVHEMAGLIIGIHVLPRDSAPTATNPLPPRNIRLLIQSGPRGYNSKPAIGFVLQNGAEPKRDSVMLPGPTLFLEKGRPVRINLVNNLKSPTSVHWHGLEIDSYPDGVAGWSGTPGKIAPVIQPRDSFIAEFTPPRAGTFIYHSHVSELRQTNSGMYGAIIVTDSTHPFDPSIDRIVLVGGGGPGSVEFRTTGMVNGTNAPRLELEAGKTHRLHLIQIHPQAAGVFFKLGTDSTTARWTPVAKDGADLPPEQSMPKLASVMMGAGENGVFLYTPERAGLQKLSIHTRAAGWYVPVLIVVRPPKKLVTSTSN
jgi:FtsP/CotA-like multicopper oxidase with cupredoxin domain